MKSINKAHLALCLAALGVVAALPAAAQEYKYLSTSQRTAGFAEKGKSSLVYAGGLYAGKFFQWFGPYQVCPSGGSTCGYSAATSRSVATAWKVGTNLTTTNTFELGSVLVNIAAEMSVTETDTDTYTFSYTINPGKTAMPATLIERDALAWDIMGVWVRDQTDVRCPLTYPHIRCDRYVWSSGTKAGRYTAFKRKYKQQGFTWLVWTNGPRPSGYKLEAD